MAEMCRNRRAWKTQGMRVLIWLVTHQYFFAFARGLVLTIVWRMDDNDNNLCDDDLTIFRRAYYDEYILIRA